MSGDLEAELKRQGAALLAAHPGLAHRWETTDGGVSLVFPASSAEGFDVEVAVHHGGLTVSGVGFHKHFVWQATAAEAVRDALGLARDLLAPAMRVRELRAADRPYRWELQARAGGAWRTEEVALRLAWTFFVPRSERIYRNSALPPRDPEK